jgi:hydrophobe/amphiphile efflux-3 (HAE3) family protein
MTLPAPETRERPPQEDEAIGFRARFESAIAALGLSAARHPWATLVLVLAAVGFCASQIPTLQFASSPDLYLDEDEPDRVVYDEMREQFGRDDLVFIAITPTGGNKVFELEFLERLRALHLRLENELPWIEEVQSLVTARQTRGVDDSLVVGEFMEEWPADDAAIARLERRALASPLYRNLYLSEDGRTTGVVVRPLTYYASDEPDILGGFEQADEAQTAADDVEGSNGDLIRFQQTDEMALVLNEILESFDFGGAEIHVVGLPVLNAELQLAVVSDMALFSGLSIVVIASLLWLVFRRVVAVILPLATVTFSAVITLGLMAFFGRPMTMVSQIVPPFILAVGVGFAVHLLSIYFQLIDRGETPEDATPMALRHSGPAILLSALTTAFGMISFIPSDLLPVRDVGIFVPVGVVTAAFLALVLVPAVLALVRIRPRANSGVTETQLPTERILVACARFGTRHPWPVVVLTLLVLGASAVAIPRIPPGYNIIDWLADDGPYVIGTAAIDASLGGGGNMEIVVDAGRENGLHDPENLRRIEAIQRYFETHPAESFSFQKTTSIANVVKEIHQALHEGRSDAYVIPDDPRLIAQELLLFENSGSDDLEQIVDSQFRLARVSLKGEHADGAAYLDYLDTHTASVRKLAGDMSLAITGMLHLNAHVVQLVIETAVESYLGAFLLITPIMILFIGSLRTGIVSMAPNLVPIAMVMGVMGWAGTRLDVFTVLIGGIALGLVVDDTLHILHGFRVNYAKSKNVDTAISETMQTTGRAVLFTTVVLVSGFSIYGFATAKSVVAFGLLTALAVFLAFVLDLFLTPALLALVHRGRKNG